MIKTLVSYKRLNVKNPMYFIPLKPFDIIVRGFNQLAWRGDRGEKFYLDFWKMIGL